MMNYINSTMHITFFESLTLLCNLLVQLVISHTINVLYAVFVVYRDVGAIGDQLFNLKNNVVLIMYDFSLL